MQTEGGRDSLLFDWQHMAPGAALLLSGAQPQTAATGTPATTSATTETDGGPGGSGPDPVPNYAADVEALLMAWQQQGGSTQHASYTPQRLAWINTTVRRSKICNLGPGANLMLGALLCSLRALGLAYCELLVDVCT